MPMTYTDDIQATVIREKMRLVMLAIVESIGDNDEAVDARNRELDKLEYQDGFEFVAPAHLSFYSSSGTGTPLHDRLVQRLLDSQAEEWKRQYPHRASLPDILTADDDGEGEFRNEAEEWETAALQDEIIYIRVEAVRDGGQIRFRSCFMNEINIPYGDEFDIAIDDPEFIALDGDELEKFAAGIADAPYKEGPKFPCRYVEE